VQTPNKILLKCVLEIKFKHIDTATAYVASYASECGVRQKLLELIAVKI
jgi:hypothetical protein